MKLMFIFPMIIPLFSISISGGAYEKKVGIIKIFVSEEYTGLMNFSLDQDQPGRFLAQTNSVAFAANRVTLAQESFVYQYHNRFMARYRHSYGYECRI